MGRRMATGAPSHAVVDRVDVQAFRIPESPRKCHLSPSPKSSQPLRLPQQSPCPWSPGSVACFLEGRTCSNPVRTAVGVLCSSKASRPLGPLWRQGWPSRTEPPSSATRKHHLMGPGFAQTGLIEGRSVLERRLLQRQLAKASVDNEETKISQECRFLLWLSMRTMAFLLYEVRHEEAHGPGRARRRRQGDRGSRRRGAPSPGLWKAGRAGFTRHK